MFAMAFADHPVLKIGFVGVTTSSAAAKVSGLPPESDTVTDQAATTDLTPLVPPMIQAAPDILMLSGVSPIPAPKLIRMAREMGYTGLISAGTAQVG